jgi:hypothetical protein
MARGAWERAGEERKGRDFVLLEGAGEGGEGEEEWPPFPFRPTFGGTI